MKRSIRRHHALRIKNKRKWYWFARLMKKPLNERRLGMILSTPTPITCWMNGNPRKYFQRKTRKELAAKFDQLQQIKEV